MGGTTRVVDASEVNREPISALREEHNKVVTDLETLRQGVAELIGSATYDPASLADGAGATTTIAVTSAALGDFVRVSFSLDLQGILLFAWVSATGTVSVRFQNESGGTVDLASGTLTVAVATPGNVDTVADLTAAQIDTVQLV